MVLNLLTHQLLGKRCPSTIAAMVHSLALVITYMATMNMECLQNCAGVQCAIVQQILKHPQEDILHSRTNQPFLQMFQSILWYWLSQVK